MLKVFRIKKIVNKINEFFSVLFYKEDEVLQLSTPLKKYTVTALFPSKDIMNNAINRN